MAVKRNQQDDDHQKRYASPQEQLPLMSISVKELVTERDRFNIALEYQRQEVWGRTKKQSFIDTLLRGDPTFPLEGYKSFGLLGNTLWEINDGSQRIRCLCDFYDGKFKTWTAKQKAHAEPNSEYPVTPNCTFETLPPQAKNYFLDYRIYINCPRERPPQAQTTRFLRINGGEGLTAAEKLNAYVSKAKGVAKRIAAHHFWEDCYEGDTKRLQVLQSSLHLLALELAFPKITVSIAEEKYISNLACGIYDAKITNALIATTLQGMDAMSLLYDGLHFTRRSLIVPMYQSVRLLERHGRTFSEKDKGKLTTWMQNIAEQSKRASSTPSYALPIQQILRESAQEQFWNIHLNTIINLLG